MSDLDSDGSDLGDGGGGTATLDASRDGNGSTPEAGKADARSAADTAPPPLTDSAVGADTSLEPDSGLGTCTGTGGPSMARVGAVCIDTTEVTNDQYAAFLAASPAMSLAPAPACSFKTSFTPTSGWPNTNKKTNPVIFVDWCDAYAFCAWAGKRLCGAVAGGPSTKAAAADKSVDQWYAACSNEGASVYPYGGNVYQSGKCNDAESNANGLRPVGSFTGCEVGTAGIFDMNGNAYEWEDACDVSVGASDGCMIRGGSWQFQGATYGGCNTYFNDYVVKRSDTYNDTGFRCCGN